MLHPHAAAEYSLVVGGARTYEPTDSPSPALLSSPRCLQTEFLLFLIPFLFSSMERRILSIGTPCARARAEVRETTGPLRGASPPSRRSSSAVEGGPPPKQGRIPVARAISFILPMPYSYNEYDLPIPSSYNQYDLRDCCSLGKQSRLLVSIPRHFRLLFELAKRTEEKLLGQKIGSV